MARYLVTGGGGFIGSNLAEALCRRGESVAVLDDFSTGNRANLAHLDGQIELIEGSVTDMETCRTAVRGAEFVLHQAQCRRCPGAWPSRCGRMKSTLPAR